LDSFLIVPKSGDTVLFSYYIHDVANTCENGKTVVLISIKAQ
jgi:hypothetical protein